MLINLFDVLQVQAIVDHHHPHDGARTTISKVRFVDPTKPDDNDKDESNEVSVHSGDTLAVPDSN
jgi:hypothetical protein